MQSPRSAHDVDELDVALLDALLDALHVNPRASFEQLATTLDVSAATVSRRWQRLSASGRAWVSSAPGPRLALAVAMYEAECVPGQAQRLAESLAALPCVASVYLTAGTVDVTALVMASDANTLSGLLLDHLPHLAGLARVHSYIATTWYSDVQWRLGAISPSQIRTVRGGLGAQPYRVAPRTLWFDDDERALYLALQYDGRARYRDLAERLGTSEQQTKQRMSALIRRGMLAFRSDFTRTEGGWPTQLMLWLAAPDERLAEIGAQVARWRETRICLAALGTANLFVNMQLHRVDELDAIFERVHRDLPGVAVVERRMVLRAVKSWGRLLDRDGHSTGVVPVDLWAQLAPPATE